MNFERTSVNRRMARILGTTASAAALLLGLAASAHAQDASDEGGIAEIIVTAQKREQNLQDVPVAVTALSEDTLKVNRVTSIMDLNGLAPGLSARQNAGSLGSPSFSMRGVFASASQPSQDRQISTYIDGVYLGSTRGAVFDLPDIQRIEVLRGPQGTLFGRNATAGAVSIVTRDPAGELKFRQEMTVGNYAQLRTRTTIDTPQFGIFSGYVTFVHDERRGDVRNLGAGVTFDRTSPFTNIGVTKSPRWLGSKNSENVFAVLKMEPSSDFSVTYKFDTSSTKNTPEARVTTVLNPNDFVGGMLTAILAAQPTGGGAYGLVTTNPGNKRPKAVNNAWTMPGYLKASGHNVTMQWQASDSLSFKNVASYRKSEAYGPASIMGLDGLQFTAGSVLPYSQFAAISYLAGLGVNVADPANAALVGGTIGAFATNFGSQVGQYFSGYEGNSYGKGSQYSNELQANYNSQLLTLTVGALYFHSKELSSGLPGMAPNFAFAPTAPQLALGNVQEARSRTTSVAAYVQGEFHLTPQFDIVAGGRITKDKKSGSMTYGGTYVGSPAGSRTSGSIVGALVTPWTFKKTKPTFSLGVNYKPNDDLMVYAKWSSAFLSGGAVGELAFKPESVTSFEAGLKSEWLDRRLRFNMALFQATYKHSQSAQSGQNVKSAQYPNLDKYGVVVVDNGTVKAKGIELEIVAAPVDGLTLGGSFSYTDIAWKSPSPLITQGRPVKPNSIPNVIGAVNAQYVTQPILGDATMLLRVDANYQGKYRATPYTDLATALPVFAPYAFNPGRWILNSRIALRDIKAGPGTVEIGAWIRNLTDNKDAVYPLLFGSIQHDSSYQQARTFGVDVIAQF